MSKVGANPTWNFKGDPAYNWVDTGLEIIYLDTPVEGSSHIDGNTTNSGQPSQWNALIDDLYNRAQYLKNRSDNSSSRGWLKYITINASRALTKTDTGLINIVTSDLGTPSTDVVELVLPTRQELTDAGYGYNIRRYASPFIEPVGNNIPSFCIEGYAVASGANAGIPLKISVQQPTVVTPGVDVDMQQSVFIGRTQVQDIWLYGGEYIELIPFILKDELVECWFLTWQAKIHRSGYDRLGQYVQMPVGGGIPFTQLRANNQSVLRAKYPRLFKALSSGGELSSCLVAQGSKTNDKYGDGNGTTTFTLPNLASLEASLVQWHLYF